VTGDYVPASLRQRVEARAARRCEYCQFPAALAFAPHQVDHVIARKHGGPTESDNLALSRVLCNRHKGSDLASVDPETGSVVLLFHPRHDRWADHFGVEGPAITPLTATGRATARLLQFNHSDRLEERRLLIAAGVFQFPE
jgi:hypothetical protein